MVIVVRGDIAPGYQVVQSTHALADFAAEHPEKFKEWKATSNYIVCLSVPNEDKLLELRDKLALDTETSLFFEPDVDSYTAFCAYGTPEIRRKLSSLPLALKRAS